MVLERKIKWHPKIASLTQIPTEGLEFAWVSDDYEQIHQLVWCKDFLHDVIYSCVNLHSISVFKLNYSPFVSPSICRNSTRMIITCWKDKNFGEKVSNNLREFMNSIEKKLGMIPTVFEKCHPVPPIYKRAGVFLLNGDARWMIAPPMISLYSLLLRVGMVHEKGNTFGTTLRGVRDGKIKSYYSSPKDNPDRNILKLSYKSIQRIIKEGDQKIFGTSIQRNYPTTDANGDDLSINKLHDKFGLVGFSQKITKDIFPHWHEEVI